MTALGMPNFAEDAAHASGDRGVLLLTVRNDSPESSAPKGVFCADGDYSPLAVNKAGHVKCQVEPTMKPHYVGTTGPFSPTSSTTVLAELFYGSGSPKVIKIHKILLSYSASSVTAQNYFYIAKNSAANSSGTATTVTAAKSDSGQASATGVMKYYASGTSPTLGTSVNFHAFNHQILANAAGVIGVNIVAFDAETFGGPIVLRASGEGVSIHNNGSTVAGTSPQVSITIFWTEEE